MFTSRRAVTLGACCAVVASSATIATVAHAEPTLRVQVDQRGDFVLIGNSIGQECAAGAPAPIVGDVGACGADVADSSPDVYWRADAPAAGMARASVDVAPQDARSTATLDLPSGATATHAFLYWAGSLAAAASPDTEVTLDRPGVFSEKITAVASFPATLGGNQPMYQSVADVTALVVAHGAGAYRVADIVAQPSFVNRDAATLFGGWSLVVFYERPGDPARNLALFDGCDVINQNTQTVVLEGLRVPSSGFDGKLGVIAYEGDASVSGDQLSWDGTMLADASNPVDNFFNGSRTVFGAGVSKDGDLPRQSGEAGSMAGLDLDVVDIAPLLVGGQESATIQASASGDTYALGAFITSVSTLVPDFSGTTKAARDVNGGVIRAGDAIEFTLVVTNGGSDIAHDTVLVDDLPAGMDYVAGSLTVDGGSRTDAIGDDVFDHDAAARRLTVRLGAGASATQGGTMAIGASTTVRFLVTLDPLATGMLENQGIVHAEGDLGAPVQSWPTASPDGPGTPTVLVVEACDDPAGCGAGGGGGSVSSDTGASSSGAGGAGGAAAQLRALGNGFVCAASTGDGRGSGVLFASIAVVIVVRRRRRRS